MDPPLFPEVTSMQTGIPLTTDRTSQNVLVRQLADHQYANQSARPWPDQDGEMPITPFSYMPNDPMNPIGPRLQPGAHVNRAINNPYVLRELDDIYRQQQASMQLQIKGKGKGKKGRDSSGVRGNTAPRDRSYLNRNEEQRMEASDHMHAAARYDGLDELCSICQICFERGEWTTRLICNHQFHEKCFNDYITNANTGLACPNCKGPPIAKQHYRHVGSAEDRGTPSPIRRPIEGTIYSDARSRQSTPSERSRSSSVPPPTMPPTSIFMVESTDEVSPQRLRFNDAFLAWSQSYSHTPLQEFVRQWKIDHPLEEPDTDVRGNTALGDQDETCSYPSLHGNTKLADRNSILVDIGSRVNLIGIQTKKSFDSAARNAGEMPRDIPRQTRLHVNGVGEGSTYCDDEAGIPIAVQFKDQPATKEYFRANVALGCGQHLPAILGSCSMEEKDAVIIMRKGKQTLAFPGPGGYRIEWSPGTKLMPLEQSPSGHLVVPCDSFAQLPKNPKTENIAFWMDHTTTFVTTTTSQPSSHDDVRGNSTLVNQE